MRDRSVPKYNTFAQSYGIERVRRQFTSSNGIESVRLQRQAVELSQVPTVYSWLTLVVITINLIAPPLSRAY
jgi:hypothetical protein